MNKTAKEKGKEAVIFADVLLTKIDSSEHTGRSTANLLAMADLKISISKLGLLQPIVLVKRKNRFQVVAGHRRLHCFNSLGRKKIPAAILQLSDEQVYLARLAENIEREDVSFFDEAQLLSITKTTFRISSAQLADKLGKSPAYISQRLAILDYHPALLKALQKERISFSVARALNKIEDEQTLIVYLQSAIDNSVTPEMAERWANEANLAQSQANTETPTAPDTTNYEEPRVAGTTCFFSDKFYPYSSMRNIWVSKEWLTFALDAIIKRQALPEEAHAEQETDPENFV